MMEKKIIECTFAGCDTKEEIKDGKQVRQFFKCTHFKGNNIQYEKNGGYYTVCKACLRSMACDDIGQINKLKFIETMKFLNKPFHEDIFNACLLSKVDTLGEYLKRMGMKNRMNETFEDSDGFDKAEIKLEGSSSNRIDLNISKLDIEITEEDLKIQKDVIRLLGYDPFAGYEKFDKKVMYGELLPYLDGQTLEDQFKISVIIQIVNNNNQIRKIDLVINQLSSDVKSLINNSNDVKSLTQIKSQLNTANDKLSKENSIALKHRADKKSGQSTIGAMMKQLRGLGFESAEHDYYDMQKAYGIKQAADISNKSICDILNFDEKDMDDMFKSQRDLIKDLQEEKSELLEKIRVLSTENFELKEQIENKKSI